MVLDWDLLGFLSSRLSRVVAQEQTSYIVTPPALGATLYRIPYLRTDLATWHDITNNRQCTHAPS